ncbi:hypothetical protein EDB86DRAFT_1068524 [Lactarius hatsudake]|nr:hypothetical protein EDB86DRAFT_1068524 [Lactarius hatsudake]
MVPRHLTTTGPPFLLYPLPSLTQIPKTQIATGQWRPCHRLRNGLLLASHLTAIPLSPSCDTWPHSDEFYFFHFFFLTHFDRAGPPAPASVTTSPQPQYHHTRIRMRCPSTLTRHLDIAATPLDLTDPLRLPPRPHYAAATRPHYDTSASVAHLDPHWRRLDTAPTITSTPPATHSPCVDPTPSAPFQHHLSACRVIERHPSRAIPSQTSSHSLVVPVVASVVVYIRSINLMCMCTPVHI